MEIISFHNISVKSEVIFLDKEMLFCLFIDLNLSIYLNLCSFKAQPCRVVHTIYLALKFPASEADCFQQMPKRQIQITFTTQTKTQTKNRTWTQRKVQTHIHKHKHKANRTDCFQQMLKDRFKLILQQKQRQIQIQKQRQDIGPRQG